MDAVKLIEANRHALAQARGAQGILAEAWQAQALVEAGVDFIVVDSAHGHSRNVLEMIAKVKANTKVEVIGGNIATRDGAQALIDAGFSDDEIRAAMGGNAIHVLKAGLVPLTPPTP